MKYKFYYLAIIISFVFYSLTFSRYITEIDAGELLAIQSLLGVAHPSGYPLFTVIGHFFSKIPVDISNIVKLNFLASIYVTLSLVIFVFLLSHLFNRAKDYYFIPKVKAKNPKEKQKIEKELLFSFDGFTNTQKSIALFIATITLGLSRTYWEQATSTEVYSLHLLLVNLSLFVFFVAYSKEHILYWLLFAFVYGLSFLNHLTVFQLLPAFAYLYFNKHKFKKEALLQVLYMIVVGLVIIVGGYSILYFIAKSDPLFNWGNPVNWNAMVNHITGWQYRVWLFQSLDVFFNNFVDKYLVNLGSEFFVIFLIIAAVGAYYTYKRFRKLFVFLMIAFLFNIFYSCNYSIHDISNYFLLSYIVIAIFVGFGVIHIYQQVEKMHRISYYYLVILSIFAIIQIYQNYTYNDKSDYSVIEDYTREYLANVDDNSVILTYQWDILVSPSYYIQFVENKYRYTEIVDKELLRRTWYFKQMKKTTPKAYDLVKEDANKFIQELLKFEEDDIYDGNYLEALYRKIQIELVTNDKFKTCYLGPEFLANEINNGIITIPEGYELVPDLFSFKIVKGKEYVPAKDPNYIIHFPKVENRFSKLIYNICGEMLVRRVMYELNFNKYERAKIYYQKLRKDFEDFPVPSDLRKLMG
ncbi:MAG TPA: DUF2723 domain-containing protein [Ignavibacteriales bacterium]|nr:DUF2723 domain-containing protein [Ignavibacteriales bacterium]